MRYAKSQDGLLRKIHTSVSDNRVAELDLNWDVSILKDHPDPFGFDADELEAMLKTAAVKEIEPKPAPNITWLLVGIPMSKYDEAQQHIAALERISNVYLQASKPK